MRDVERNAQILAQLALLGTDGNSLEDFLKDDERGGKLLHGLQTLDPALTGFRAEDVYAAAQGLARLAGDLLAHLVEKHKGDGRIKNLMASGKLMLLLRGGPALERKALNRIIGTFYADWPYAAHWRRDVYRIPAGGLTVMALVFGGLQKLRDLLDEQMGLS